MAVEYFFKSDLGKIRQTNEDTIQINADHGLFLICDGFGESSYGKVASTLSADTVAKFFSYDNQGKSMPLNPDLSPDALILATAVQLANLRLFNFVDRFIDYYGMGSTVAAVYLKKGFANIAHIGDSRVYLLRDHNLSLLTYDHSYVNELIRMGRLTQENAHRYANKHFITRSLGMAETIKIDMNIVPIKKDDIFLLCSDGLNHMVPDDEIAKIIETNKVNFDKATADLIKRSNELGGEDDISVVLIRVKDVVSSPASQFKTGVVYLSDASSDMVNMENSLLQEIFGKDLYPREVQYS